jgi:hypothetical protein
LADGSECLKTRRTRASLIKGKLADIIYSRQVALRVYAKWPSGISIEAYEHGFLLVPEHARQIIRELCAAVMSRQKSRRLSEFAPRLVIRAGTLGVNESASSLREPIDESLRAR